MRKLIVTAGVLGSLALSPVAMAASGSAPSAGTAGGASLTSISEQLGVGLPFVPVSSLSYRPAGFSSSAGQAVTAAKATNTMQSLHRHMHPLYVQPFLFDLRRWAIDFSFHGKLVAEAEVSPAGRVTGVFTGPLALAVYARGHFAPMFDAWWVVVPFSLLFLLPFLNIRRPFSLLHLDALVVLSFFVSYGLFDHLHLEAGVWAVYPPLLYLAARMAWVGFRRGGGHRSPLPAVPVRLLAMALLMLVCGRSALSLLNKEVVDVGYASVLGAHRIAHGQSLYYAAAGHGDTYGPVAYLFYVPFEVLFPWHGAWDYLASAHAASVFFDLVTILGLVALGRRLRPGPDGVRLGLLMGWAWAACPFTLLGLMMHTNDGLIAMLSVLALLVFSSPAARGAMVGLAAAAKFSPAGLLPLFASPRDRGLRGTLACTASFLAVAGTAVGLYLPSGGIKEFYDHTIGYQLSRPDVFSPWALHPGLNSLKLVLTVAAVLVAAMVAFVPRERSLVQVSALAALVTIAVQLPAVHWFYYYIIWFAPFLLVALLGRREPALERQAAAAAEVPTPLSTREPVLAGT